MVLTLMTFKVMDVCSGGALTRCAVLAVCMYGFGHTSMSFMCMHACCCAACPAGQDYAWPGNHCGLCAGQWQAA
eukprot:scaffold240718_cov19-Tisochrysis_lutea.AAC.1